jgi:hypothetical protein
MPRASRKTERAHIERLARKQERLQMLRAFIQEWEEHPTLDKEYLGELYRKAETLQNQISVMAI